MDDIDRITPTKRPDRHPVMKHRWAELGFLHWRVPAEVLRPIVPAQLAIDTFEGDAYVGLVPFTMTGIRPVYAPPAPGLSNFHEINVRTYVHHEGREPGVWFFSLDAANSFAVRVARALFHLPYHRASMSLEKRADGSVSYRSERRWPGPTPADARLEYGPAGPAAESAPGTLEHFLAERYNLYARSARGQLSRGRVHHAPYPLQPGRATIDFESLLAAAGIDRPAHSPLVHFAREVRVEVFATERVG